MKGSGKTTLLDILAGRKTSGKISGEILFNDGLERSTEIMKSISYVTSENILYSTLTVRQTLHYAAEFRLDQNMKREEKNKRIDFIMNLFDLDKLSDNIIGNEYNKSLSGGEIKRVSVAVEVIHFPEILFLDEPTTG